MSIFDEVYQKWMEQQIAEEKSPRRREMLRKGLSRGSIDFLRLIWFPVIGSLNHLYPEYEIRDFNNGYRYLDFAYLPGNVKGCIEIQDYRSHARDIEVSRFKDLCMKQSLLVLDDWLFLPIAYLSIRDDPGVCKQLVLSFVGKFLASSVPSGLGWAEAETLRFAHRLLRPFTPVELSGHLLLSEHRVRVILRGLIEKKLLEVASGKQRYRSYRLTVIK
ncbi:transcriptional regulator [Paenibacillus enshidis]|uniref:Transcriptional regulator n=1 Tax=Paenibacillus enshidis TaxID=1458439 RepID=A0ABV5ATQ9_9BACL